MINDYINKSIPFQIYQAGTQCCKFLTTDGKCSIYSVRPIDCRVHFCSGADMASIDNTETDELVNTYHMEHEQEFLDSKLIDDISFTNTKWP